MGSLWAYIEGMDVHCLLFTGTKGSDWLPGPDLALWTPLMDVCSSPELLDAPEVFAACLYMITRTHEEPLGIYWRNGWPSPPFHGGKQLQFGCLGHVWHFGPLRWTFAPPELLDAPEFFAACLYMLTRTHEEPLGIY